MGPGIRAKRLTNIRDSPWEKALSFSSTALKTEKNMKYGNFEKGIGRILKDESNYLKFRRIFPILPVAPSKLIHNEIPVNA